MFGGNIFGWTVDEAVSFQLLDAFLETGFNFIDTANSYSRWVEGHQGGESETIIGKWMKDRGKRNQVILATKVASEMGPGEKGLSKAQILKQVENSLQRLQTHTIDLYQSHFDDPNTPVEETLGAYAQLAKEGKVRFIGASNYGPDRLAESLEISTQKGFPRYESLQPHYNLYERSDYEKKLEPLCREKNLGVIPYFSLAAGFLTGKYRTEADASKSLRGPGIVKKYLNERGFRILKALDEVAQNYQSKPGRVALAWLLSRPSVTAPIVSATTLEQWEDLVEATRLKLDSEAILRLDEASAEDFISA
jgi:aryl-alcohol dehydrogenase-like predicted oxidoreductase